MDSCMVRLRVREVYVGQSVDSNHPFNWVDLTWVNHFDKFAH